jgi:hypothetical protein
MRQMLDDVRLVRVSALRDDASASSRQSRAAAAWTGSLLGPAISTHSGPSWANQVRTPWDEAHDCVLFCRGVGLHCGGCAACVLLGWEPVGLRHAAPAFERVSPAVDVPFVDVVVKLGAVCKPHDDAPVLRGLA